MCRLMAYVGPPVLIADVVLWPDRSIIKQSYDAKERRDDSTLPDHLSRGNLNGDGFGIGWFCIDSAARGDRTPCVFTSVTPAWNNDNLARLSCKIVSPLVFAHVRAAYPGMSVSEQNCHPFQWGSYMFMHNGVMGGFMRLRRALLGVLSDDAYNAVQSFHSDSAVAFALFLHHLPDMRARQPPEVLLQAMQATIACISRLQSAEGVTDPSLLNYVVSDGSALVASRYVWPPEEPAASLYYAEGNAFTRVADHPRKVASNAARSSSVRDEGEYALVPPERGPRCVLVASEPITHSATDWVEVPKQTIVVVSPEKNGYVNTLRAPVVPEPGPRATQIGDSSVPLVTGDSIRLQAIAAAASSASRPWTTSRPAYPAAAAMPSEHRDGPDASAGGRPPLARSGGAARSAASSAACPEEHCLTGHSGTVTCLALRGSTLYSGGVDGTIKAWDLTACKCIVSAAAHAKPLRQLLERGGTLYSTACQKMRVWDAAAMACKRTVQAARRTGHHWALAVGQDGWLYTGGQDCVVRAYRPHPEDVVQAEGGGKGGAAAVPNGGARSPGLPADSGDVTIPDATTGAGGHCCSVNALAVARGYVCSAGGDAVIHVWRQHDLTHVRCLAGHRGSVLTLCALGDLVLSGGRDNVIRVWDMEALVCRRTLSGHKDDVLSIAALANSSPSSPSGRLPAPRWANGANGGEAQGASGEEVEGEEEAASPLWTVVASSSADSSVRLWSTRCWSCLAVFTPGAGPGGAPATMPLTCVVVNEQYVVAGAPDGLIRMWSCEAVLAFMARAAGGTGSGCALAALERQTSDESSLTLATTPLLASGDVASPPPSKRARSCSNASVLDGIQRIDAAAPPAPSALAAPGGGCGDLAARVERELEGSLRQFVRLRSVSGDPALREDSFRAAKFVARLLESLGCEMKMVRAAEDKNPLVLGRLGRDPNVPTVTFYGHYDVQPALEREWRTDPFEVAAIDGYLYGRGTSDNKGPILAFIYAVKQLQEENGGALPVNVAFAFEGEEENGSVGFGPSVQANAHFFEGTQLVVISNTLWVGEKTPCLTYGMRGMIALSIEVVGASRDLHSGNDGGVFNEPLADLSKVLASLVDSHSNIMVPGFCDHVRPALLDAALSRLEAAPDEFSLEGYSRQLGLAGLTSGRSVRDLLAARWCAPTLSIVDVRVSGGSDAAAGAAGASSAPSSRCGGHAANSCYRFGPTRFSVIPASATGQVSIRYVPNQTPDELIDCLNAHVDHEFGKLRSANSCSVRVHSVGDWWEADPTSPLCTLAERVIESEWGAKPLLVREGGTMPVARLLERLLGAPALLLPMGQSSDACHLANERLRRTNLVRGKNVIKRLLAEVQRALAK